MKQELVDEMLIQLDDDWLFLLGVFSIIWQDEGPRAPDPNWQAALPATFPQVIELTTHVLEQGYAIAGDVRINQGFISWELSPSATIDRIEQDYANLGRGLEMGDICWFQITDKGQAAVDAVWESRGGRPEPPPEPIRVPLTEKLKKFVESLRIR